MNISAINGSPHTNGTTANLLKTVLVALKEVDSEVETEMISLATVLKTHYNPSLSLPDEIKELLEIVWNTDALIIGTPVQWFGPSDLMTTFINFLTELEVKGDFALEGKPVAFIATCNEDGAMMAISKMAGTFSHMGCLIPPYCMFFHNTSMAGGSEKNWQERDVPLLGQNLIRAVLRNKGQSWRYPE